MADSRMKSWFAFLNDTDSKFCKWGKFMATQQAGNKRYQALIISIAVFLGLIALLLAFTFYTSSLLERNAALMNQTNRVSNAAQSVIKDLFDLENSYGEDVRSPHIKTVLARLQQNSQIISDYIPILKNGGEIETDHGTIKLSAASSQIAQQNLELAESQWALLNPKITTYLKSAANVEVNSSDALFQAATQAKTSSLLVNESLDNLVQQTTLTTNRQAATIRLVQLIGVAIIFAYFLIFIFFFIRRLRESDYQADMARQETTEIMQTVNTGLFLLDKDLTIGQQYSNALESIIGAKDLAGEKLSSVLRNRVSDKDLRTAEEFIEQLYNPKAKEKLIKDLNPLQKVMMQNSHDNKTRYLDFKFSRVYEDKQIKRILVNVNDVSDAVLLEQNLEKERAHNDMQIEMLTTILNVSPHIINEFISNTYAHIQRMNDVLKNPGSSQFELEGKLKLLYREMHSLKGEASALKLSSFAKIASEAEDKLHVLQNQGKLSGNDFLALTVHLDELLSLSNVIAGLGQRINSHTDVEALKAPISAPVAAPVAAQDNQQDETDDIITLTDDTQAAPAQVNVRSEFADYLVAFGADIAKRQNKEIYVDVSRLGNINLPKRLSTTVREICVQLLRNAIVHGIAPSDQRVEMGKPRQGRVSIVTTTQDSGYFVFYVEDDGRGIDYEVIRNKLVTSGRMDAEKAATLTKSELLNVIFNSGFSTKSVVDEDSGRGVGLDIVKDRVKMAGGKIAVESEKGKFCRFTIKLPIQSSSPAMQ